MCAVSKSRSRGVSDRHSPVIKRSFSKCERRNSPAECVHASQSVIIAQPMDRAANIRSCAATVTLARRHAGLQLARDASRLRFLRKWFRQHEGHRALSPRDPRRHASQGRARCIPLT
eukprot:6178614-Pleurochrysis_carterae.AAC.1